MLEKERNTSSRSYQDENATFIEKKNIGIN